MRIAAGALHHLIRNCLSVRHRLFGIFPSVGLGGNDGVRQCVWITGRQIMAVEAPTMLHEPLETRIETRSFTG